MLAGSFERFGVQIDVGYFNDESGMSDLPWHGLRSSQRRTPSVQISIVGRDCSPCNWCDSISRSSSPIRRSPPRALQGTGKLGWDPSPR